MPCSEATSVSSYLHVYVWFELKYVFATAITWSSSWKNWFGDTFMVHSQSLPMSFQFVRPNWTFVHYSDIVSVFISLHFGKSQWGKSNRPVSILFLYTLFLFPFIFLLLFASPLLLLCFSSLSLHFRLFSLFALVFSLHILFCTLSQTQTFFGIRNAIYWTYMFSES